jgi:hypothetical protein
MIGKEAGAWPHAIKKFGACRLATGACTNLKLSRCAEMDKTFEASDTYNVVPVAKWEVDLRSWARFP